MKIVPVILSGWDQVHDFGHYHASNTSKSIQHNIIIFRKIKKP